MTNGIYGRGWGGEQWSEWYNLYELWTEYNAEWGRLDEIPSGAGIYRVRHCSDEDGELTYIGQSSDLHRRVVTSLGASVFSDEPDEKLSPEMPYRAPHAASPCIWAICHDGEPELEVSITHSDRLEDKQLRETIEDALIALYRKEIGESPTAQFSRMIPGYKQSTYKSRDNPTRGGVLGPDETEPKCESGVGPVPWENTEQLTSETWMGLEWSEPYRLRDRKEISAPEEGIYRIWYEGHAPPLAYIGESSNVSGRLYSHENNFGGDAFFSYIQRSDLDAQHKRREIETDLIGAHYLECGGPPLAQFGQKDNVPP